MNYIQVFKDSFNLLRRTKLVWIFSTLFLLGTFLPSAQNFRGDVPLVCTIWLISCLFIFISFRAQGGLIYIIHQALNNEKATFSEGWFQGKVKFFRVVVVTLIIVPFFMLLFIPLLLSKKLLLVILYWLVLAPLFGGCINFAYCGIVINGIKPIRAAWIGLLITLNNIFKIIILTIIIYIMMLFPLSIFVIAVSYSPFNINLPSPFPLDYMTYLKLMANPVIHVVNQVLMMMIYPLQSTVLVIAYNKFTGEISYPGLASRRENE